MKVIHITLTECRNESRLLKEVTSISLLPKTKVNIVALGSKDLKTKEYFNEIFIKRINIVSRKFGKNRLSLLIKFLEFCIRSSYYIGKEKVDVLSIHCLALLPLGVFIKTFYRCILVYDAHELETETNGLSGINKKLSKFLERSLIRYVDKVIVVNESIKKWYETSYSIEPMVIFNSPPDINTKKNNYFRKKFNIRSESKILLYQGLISPGRGIEFLIKTITEMKTNNFVIIFLGYGPQVELIKKSSITNKNIFFHEAVKPEELLAITSSADIGISLIEDVCLSYRYCLPNKVFEYSMAGLPIIVSNLEEMRHFVFKYKNGWVIDMQNESSLSNLLEIIKDTNLEKYQNKSKLAAIENSWEIQEKKLLAYYGELLNRHQKGI